MTPLMMATEQGNQNMVIALLNAGANPMIQNYLGRTAEQLAISQHPKKEIKNILRARMDEIMNSMTQS